MELIYYRLVTEGTVYIMAVFSFLIAGVFYLSSIGKRRFKLYANFFFILAFVLLSIYILKAWLATGQPPFKTMFQSLVFLVWNISIIYFILEKTENLYFLGGFVSLFNLLVLVFSMVFSDIVKINLPPALQSVWFIPHVVLYFAGYSFLFIGFLMSILYILFPGRKYLGKEHWSGQLWKDYDMFSYRAIVYGFTFLTLGLSIGAIWAKGAWGSFWSWDPKENWALITWFVYLTYFHMRYVKGWKGKRAAVLSIIGFAVIIMTYIGVNYLPSAQSTLHAYQ